jgi:hypothetical protein
VFFRLLGERGVQYRIAALVLSAIEAVYLKRALLASSTLPTFAIWSLFGLIRVLPFIAKPRAAQAGTVVWSRRQLVATYYLGMARHEA